MKLKLELQNSVTLLVATESIGVQQVSVLKAGLNKLIQSGKTSLVLDLTALKPGELAAGPPTEELIALRDWAGQNGGRLVIASPTEGLGDFLTREEAVKAFGSALSQLLAAEAQLKGRLKRLQDKKGALESKIAAAGGSVDIKALRRENSDRKARVRSLEGDVQAFFKARTQPLDSEPMQAKTRVLETTLLGVLEKEGVVSVK